MPNPAQGQEKPLQQQIWGQSNQGTAQQGRLWSGDLHVSSWEAQHQRLLTLWKGEDLLQSESFYVFFYDHMIKYYFSYFTP